MADVAAVLLNHGRLAFVDENDVAYISKWCWRITGSKHLTYAITTSSRPNRRNILMHRMILGIECHAHLSVDHADCNGLNNRRNNVRIATHSQNMQNRRSHVRKIKGVYRDKRDGSWWATVEQDNLRHRLGPYPDEMSARTRVRPKSTRIVWRMGAG